ncbi:MAG: PAS domain-containing protein [Deltaproteobacteria bacterium]|nr:PAS domain-containing protein [Deltaproteobacteria bacterium]
MAPELSAITPAIPPSAENDGLLRRLVWTTLARIALVSLLLSASAVILFRVDEGQLSTLEQALFSLIIVSYGASLAYLLVLRSVRERHRRLAWAQVVGDVLIAASLVWLTGGVESIFVFMFPLAVVTASVLLYRRGAIVAAVLSSLALSVVGIGLNTGLLPTASSPLQRMPLSRLTFFLFAHSSAVFLSAALASYLAEQLRSTKERLSLKEQDYLVLELLHESILRSVGSGIVTADRYGRITFLNRAAERVLCCSLIEAQGEPIERRLPALEGHLKGTPFERFEAEHSATGGPPRRLGFAVSPLYDREGTSQGHVVAVEDLTSIRAMEEGLKRSEKLAAVGALAAGLAHELRNPLASISGSIQLLHENRAFGDDERQLMSIVLRETDRLNALVTDFLRFARPKPNQLEPLDLREVVSSTVTLFRNDPTRREVVLEEELAEELPVMADVGQLGQVLWNLLGNAAEAMSGRGGRVRLIGKRWQSEVVLEVADDGPGIAAEDMPHIFEPFYTTKARGTGLGLAIVHAIVQGHGGEVQVRSEEGRGTAFTVRLPARSEQAVSG